MFCGLKFSIQQVKIWLMMLASTSVNPRCEVATASPEKQLTLEFCPATYLVKVPEGSCEFKDVDPKNFYMTPMLTSV